jgi:predicted nucleotidyltransferase
MKDKWLQRFKNEVVPILVKEFKPENVIVFGSRVTGNANKDSDIDVVIIAQSFKGIPFIKRMPMALRKARFPKHIDYICYTPNEFDNIKNKSSLIIDALETGLKVA